MIVEEKDADQKEKQTREINTGIFCVKTPLLKKFLEALTNDNANEEYYLTDIIKYASNQRFSIDTVSPSLDFEAKGVNSKQQLAELERDYPTRIRLPTHEGRRNNSRSNAN